LLEETEEQSRQRPLREERSTLATSSAGMMPGRLSWLKRPPDMKAEDHHFEIARSLFREANDAFFLFKPGSQIVLDLNPAALRLTGLEKRVACTMSLSDLFIGIGPQEFQQLAKALNRTVFFHSREGYFLRRATGRPLPVNVSVSRIHTEPEPTGLVVARDISDARRAEEALKQAEARYNSLLDSTGVVVWEVDSEGVIVALSAAFETTTGWLRRKWINRPFHELVHPDDSGAALEFLCRAIQGEDLPRFELRIRTRSGNHLQAEFLLVTKIRHDSHERVMGICRDITEQRCAEKALEEAEAMRQARDAAEQASRAKSEFLSNVSHEIRTPLSALLGFTELMNEHAYLQNRPVDLAHYLSNIREHGHVLLGLIDDLLDMARIEAGQLRVVRETCPIRQVVTDLVESLRSRAEAKNLAFAAEIAGTVPSVVATDRLRLQQILLNLLDNAIKFTSQGTVKLSARVGEQATGEPMLLIEVSDSGIGMTDAEMAGLFQAFYRVRSGTLEAPRGTGLGLAISLRLARQLGGNLTVRSTPGAGSIFTLSLPVGMPVPEALEDTGPAEKPAGSLGLKSVAESIPCLQARILLAEDHDANRQVITLRLNQAGAEVIQARNGKEAIDLIHDAASERPIDAVIMDTEMPILDGYEAVRQLRAGGFTGPIIAVTACAMSRDREECLKLGCNDHISKPIQWDQFFVKLSQLLHAGNGRSN
jgi:PAS domain S-box-containing protein